MPMSKIKTSLSTSQRLISQYELNTKIVIISGCGDYGFYSVLSDTIYLKEYYNSYDEFLLTLLHEICHALDNKRLGKKFIKKYKQASNIATHYGLNAHDYNKWEIKAENWAIKEKNKWL
jgi:antirestriction protein ArdC